MKIVPAVLTESPEELRRMIACAEGFCDLAQIDIMDGKFVPSRSISAEDLSGIKTSLRLEIHLMVEEPSKYLEVFKRAGAERIVFHYESKEDAVKVIKQTRALGLGVGIAINPQTSLAEVKRFFKSVDLILLLSVNPGFYGSKFIPEVCDKAREIKDSKGALIVAMDGGLKKDNILTVRDAGVDIACVGSGIFGGEDPAQSYRSLLEILSRPSG